MEQCPCLALFGLQGRAASSPSAVPGPIVDHSDTHVALYITASLPLSAPSFLYGSAEDTHLQDIFTETFPLHFLSSDRHLLTHLSNVSFFEPHSLTCGFHNSLRLVHKILVMSSYCLVTNLRQESHVLSLCVLITAFCFRRDK